MKPELIISVIALIMSVTSVFSSVYFSRLGIKTNVLPALVFIYNVKAGWSLRNVGNGPALNVLVARRLSSDSDWDLPTRIYPIGKGEEVSIPWVGHNPKLLAVSYQDAHNRTYTSICDNDLTKIQEGKKLPEWDEGSIERIWSIS